MHFTFFIFILLASITPPGLAFIVNIDDSPVTVPGNVTVSWSCDDPGSVGDRPIFLQLKSKSLDDRDIPSGSIFTPVDVGERCSGRESQRVDPSSLPPDITEMQIQMEAIHNDNGGSAVAFSNEVTMFIKSGSASGTSNSGGSGASSTSGESNSGSSQTSETRSSTDSSAMSSTSGTASLPVQTGESPTPVATSSKSSNKAALIGGVVGGVVFLGIFALVAFLFFRRRRIDRRISFHGERMVRQAPSTTPLMTRTASPDLIPNSNSGAAPATFGGAGAVAGGAKTRSESRSSSSSAQQHHYRDESTISSSQLEGAMPLIGDAQHAAVVSPSSAAASILMSNANPRSQPFPGSITSSPSPPPSVRALPRGPRQPNQADPSAPPRSRTTSMADVSMASQTPRQLEIQRRISAIQGKLVGMEAWADASAGSSSAEKDALANTIKDLKKIHDGEWALGKTEQVPAPLLSPGS